MTPPRWPSQLVTNAVRHGRVPVTVRLSCDGRCVRVEVHDTGGQLPHLRAPSGEHGGFGLHLIDAVSTNWGVVKSGAGKVIWCELTTGLLSGE